MNKLIAKLIHLKIALIGDKKLEEEGRILPCYDCGKLFKSYCHYSNSSVAHMAYDKYCDECINNYESRNKTRE